MRKEFTESLKVLQKWINAANESKRIYRKQTKNFNRETVKILFKLSYVLITKKYVKDFIRLKKIHEIFDSSDKRILASLVIDSYTSSKLWTEFTTELSNLIGKKPIKEYSLKNINEELKLEYTCILP